MVRARGGGHPPHRLTEAGGEQTREQVQLAQACPHYILSRASTHFVKFLLPPKIAPRAGDEEFDP